MKGGCVFKTHVAHKMPQDANDYIANGNKDSGLIQYANYCEFHLIHIILSSNNSLLHLTITHIVKSSLL